MINKLIVKNMFSDHGRIKLKINKDNKIPKYPEMKHYTSTHR